MKDGSWTKSTHFFYGDRSTRVGANEVQYVGIPVSEGNGVPTVWGIWLRQRELEDKESRDLKVTARG